MRIIMRHFIKILPILFSLCSFSQTSYYWSGGKKIFLNIDSTSITTTEQIESDDNKLRDTLSSQSVDIQNIHRFKNKDLIHFKTNNGSKNLSMYLKNRIKSKEISYAYTFGTDIPFLLTGEILLMPKDDINITNIIDLFKNDLEILLRTEYNTYKLKVYDWSKIIDISNKIYESGLVEYCHPNFITEIVKHQVDPLYADQYYLNNTGQFGGTAGIDINAPEAWNISQGLRNVRVAVIDDGIGVHEDMANRILQGFTPTDPNGFGAPIQNPPPVALHIFGHGECCAGIISATHNNIGIAGISPTSQIIPVNIFSDWIIETDPNTGNQQVRFLEDAFDLRDAIDWAWNQGQAEVLSNSWGFPTSNTGLIPHADEIVGAINRARTQGRGGLGSIVVFSSGNDNERFSGVCFPANVAGVVTVGAIDRNGSIWNYSSRGAEMDLVAPSGGTTGDVRTTDRMGADGYNAGNYNTGFNGTSAACPQVAGVAALLLAINSTLTEAQVVNILNSTATDMGSSGFDNTYGNGRLNAQGAIQGAFNSFVVTGSTPVCSSGQQFTINPVPAGYTVNWTCSSNLRSVYGGSNFTVLISNGDGDGWVRATLNGPLGILPLNQFSVWVGMPESFPSNFAINGSYSVPIGITSRYWVQLSLIPRHRTSFDWSFTGPFVFTKSHYNMVDCYIKPSSSAVKGNAGFLKFIVTNTCGSRTFSSERLVVVGSASIFTIFPNPASNTVKVEINTNQNSDTTINTPIFLTNNNSKITNYTINIYNNFGTLFFSTIKTGDSFYLPINNLVEGTYLIEVNDGKQSYSQQLIVKH
jgi:serine protease